MSGWISSKLKVAENLLQQFDQQAAESLGKNEKLQSDELNYETPTKAAEILPLKDQLKKKTPEPKDLIGKFRSGHTPNVANNKNFVGDRKKDKETAAYVNTKTKSSVTDSDWTELLSVPSKTTNGSNGDSGPRGLRKDGRRHGSSGSSLSGLVAKQSKKAQNNSASNSLRKSDMVQDGKVNGGSSDASRGEYSRFSDSTRSASMVNLQIENENKTREMVKEDANGSFVAEHTSDEKDKRYAEMSDSKDDSVDRNTHLMYENKSSVIMSPTADGISDMKIKMTDDHIKLESTMGGICESNAALRKSAFTKGASSSGSDGASDSDTDSVSSSDSEEERKREERRRRREQILAEKAAAKATETIKERENKVARLEGEKQSLEKILEDRAKQQAQEASELQMTMMETMDAVDLEKQKHKSTRMEALSRLAKLETENADLAKSLAASQWNLEVEVTRVAELRQQIELKEATHEEIRRKISSTHQNGERLVASKGVEFENEILEAEYSFLTDKVGRLQEKARTLETSIKTTRKEMEDPTEVEVELKKRLSQMTDHLIQKQSQVEGLSSEKAMVQFRIEAVSRMLDENKSMLDGADFPSTSSRDDLKSGSWDFSNSKLRPLFENRIRSGKKHLSSLVWQLDYIFSAGAVFLRRNSAAKSWATVYLVCLHMWVLYILMSHSPVSEEAGSGAVFSLENINKTGGI